MVEETVYPDGDDIITLTLSDISTATTEFPMGIPYPFLTNSVSKIELIICGVVFTSDDGVITWDDDGHIKIKIGMDDKLSELSTGIKHSCIVKVYDPAHINGQIMVSPKEPHANLTIEIDNPCTC